MTNKTFSETAICGICGKELTWRNATRHLKSCRRKNPLLPIGVRPMEIFMLRIRGTNDPDYVLIVEMPGDRSLETLDDYLRKMWLECCGHLSTFTINGKRYNSYDEAFIDEGEEPEMTMYEVVLSEVLSPRLKFTYEYDFGSSTDLELEIIDVRNTFEQIPTYPILLMRNKPPQFKCEICGKPATFITAVSCSLKYGTKCCSAYTTATARKDKDFYYLHLVNSPRTGVCAYDTET